MPEKPRTGRRLGILTSRTSRLVFAFALVTAAWAQAGLEYQNRGNRYEGIRPKPVAGYNIELLSALVNSNENFSQMPDRLRIRFYLEQSSQVYLTVRELDYRYYYWMDRIHPSSSWSPGFNNMFEWSTADVLQRLSGMKAADLGALARLGRPEPGAVEHVAPVILYSSRTPTKAEEYLFTFKTSADARLRCFVYRHEDTAPLYTLNFPRQPGGRPFVVRWNSSNVPNGAYEVLIKGYFLDTNAPIDQTVSFYHQPLVSE